MFFCRSTPSWDRPPRAWPQLCPSGAASARPQPSSCVSTSRSWSCSGSVRNRLRVHPRPLRSWTFGNVAADFCFLSFADESLELQTQICNGFKSLVVQLQGERARRAERKPLSACVAFSCCLVLSAEMLNKCRGDLLGMKDGKLKTQPSLLENLIFFVEVRPSCFHTHCNGFFLCRWGRDSCPVSAQTTCIVLWVASHCTKTLRPLKTSLQKKKKKKRKETSTDAVLF